MSKYKKASQYTDEELRVAIDQLELELSYLKAGVDKDVSTKAVSSSDE